MLAPEIFLASTEKRLLEKKLHEKIALFFYHTPTSTTKVFWEIRENIRKKTEIDQKPLVLIYSQDDCLVFRN